MEGNHGGIVEPETWRRNLGRVDLESVVEVLLSGRMLSKVWRGCRFWGGATLGSEMGVSLLGECSRKFDRDVTFAEGTLAYLVLLGQVGCSCGGAGRTSRGLQFHRQDPFRVKLLVLYATYHHMAGSHAEFQPLYSSSQVLANQSVAFESLDCHKHPMFNP